MLTQKEIYVIEAIVSNEFSGYNYSLPEASTPYAELKQHNGDCCWANSIEDNGAEHGRGVTGKELSGVVGSLNKKGFVRSCGMGRDATVYVTEAGWVAYQEVAKNNFQGETDK